MTKKNNKKAPAKKTNSNKLAKESKLKKKMFWVGAKRFLDGEKGDVARRQLQVVADVLDVTPLGVNILGNKPYINNLGRKDKMKQYTKNKGMFVYNWIKRSESDEDKAICEARIYVNGQPIKVNGTEMPWIAGECSPASIKMGTLKGYQNHMAQTRAENRAFEYAYGLKLHYETMERIGKRLKSKDINQEDAKAVAEATSGPSVEEMQTQEVVNYDDDATGMSEEVIEIIEVCQNNGIKDMKSIVKEVNEIGDIGITKINELSRKEAKKVLAQLMVKYDDNN